MAKRSNQAQKEAVFKISALLMSLSSYISSDDFDQSRKNFLRSVRDRIAQDLGDR